MTALDRVTDALTAAGSSQRYGGNWHCPGSMHSSGDRNPSLSVAYNGRTVALNCHLGCDTNDILEILGLEMTDLFDEPLVRREVARYKYLSDHGEVLFAKIRMEPKTFTIEHPHGNGWEKGLGDIQRVIYNLPSVLETAKAGGQVFIVEGEKDADRLTGMGLTATCNFEGGGTGKSKWKPEYSEWLRGASIVVVIADRDDPGVAHAKGIAASLKGLVSQVSIMQSKTTGQGDDVSDHLNAGYTLEQLVLLKENEITRQYSPVNWLTAFKEQPEDVQWLVPDFIEEGTLNAIYSAPGIGKSLLALEVAVEIVRSGKTVLYVDQENRISDTVERLTSFGVRPEELSNLLLYSFPSLPPLDTPDGGAHLAALAADSHCSLIILDTLSRMVEGAENESDTYLSLYRNTLAPLKGKGIATLRLDHSGKNERNGQRGSSSKNGDIDVLFHLTRDDTEGRFFSLECEKSRSGHIAHGQLINLEREYDPLRHRWNVRIDIPLSRFEGIMRQMDLLGIPTSYGRDRVRKVLKDNSVVGVRNDLLSASIQERRNRERRQSPVAVPATGTAGTESYLPDPDCPF